MSKLGRILCAVASAAVVAAALVSCAPASPTGSGGGVSTTSPSGTSTSTSTSSTTTTTTTVPPVRSSTLASEATLWAGDGLRSPNGRYRLDMQQDGNLVVYEGFEARWWTGTGGVGAGAAVVMQGDGNLVVYAAGSRPVWSTGTYAPGSVLTLQDDGNLVIYSPSRGALWDRFVGRNGSLDTLGAGQTLFAEQRLVSPDGRFRLVVQGDGNIVLYEGNTSRWSTGTNGPGGRRLVMQSDGNLVVYAPGGVAVWNTQTQVPGSVLTLQNDGNLVIYAPGLQAIWDRNRGPLTAGGPAQQAANEGRALVSEGAWASARALALFTDAEWAPGKVGEWAGDCPKLPYAAWYFATNGAVRIAKGNAIANYNTYKAQGRIQQGVPPVGAVTFYAATAGNAYGHTALSLGDGTVATTTGLDGAGTANTVRPYASASSGAYLGYFMPG